MSNTVRSRGTPCAACTYFRKSCPQFCESAKFFPRVINRQDYSTIFSIFGVKNVVSILKHVPDYKYLETLKSFLFEARARVDYPIGGCTTLIISLQQKLEALQSRVTALEARLGGGYSSANPSLFLAPLGSSSRFLSSADNIAPEVVPTTVNLPQPGVLPNNGDLLGYPCSEGLFRLLMSTENTASNTLPTTMNLSEHRAFPTYPNMSDYQALLEGFSGGSSQVGSVAEQVPEEVLTHEFQKFRRKKEVVERRKRREKVTGRKVVIEEDKNDDGTVGLLLTQVELLCSIQRCAQLGDFSSNMGCFDKSPIQFTSSIFQFKSALEFSLKLTDEDWGQCVLPTAG
ncbi:hypothetical protein LguiB_013386 [Lonicera macranthoides]